MCPKVIAITGSPGTGKSTLGARLRQHGFHVISVETIAQQMNALDQDNDIREIETSKLQNWRWEGSETCFIDGHLSHYCFIDAAVVLRCHPSVLRQRLSKRRGYDSKKIESNVEWELIAGTWSDLVNLHPYTSVLELDTTNQSIDLERVLQFLANGDGDGQVQDAIHRAQDWMNA